jgi:nucleoside-diphosphate-sugar epimerase
MSDLPKCFVTGATGFIGACLVHALVERGHVVHALTRRGKPAPPPGFATGEGPNWDHPNIRLVDGDITDRESLRRGMVGCSHVYHLAGYAKNWARNKQTYFDINVIGLCNVCDIAKELAAERVVWTSTMLTFGPTKAGEIADETYRSSVDNCLTEYERSKWAAEFDAVNYAADGLPVVIVNPGRVLAASLAPAI